jgi:hypothetical protein
MVTWVDGPALLTVTTAVLLLDHVTVRSVMDGSAVTVATRLAVCCGERETVDGVTVTD